MLGYSLLRILLAFDAMGGCKYIDVDGRRSQMYDLNRHGSVEQSACPDGETGEYTESSDKRDTAFFRRSQRSPGLFPSAGPCPFAVCKAARTGL
jgi:hypothetical protein